MAYSRESIYKAVETMDSAAKFIKGIIRIAGKSELVRADRMKVDSFIRELTEDCPMLATSIREAALVAKDQWNEIENNRARMSELEIFIARYQDFRATVLEFDDWRAECYEKIDIWPKAHEIAMSLVLMCDAINAELEFITKTLEKSGTQGRSLEKMLEDFETEMEEFCTIPVRGYLINQIRHTKETSLKAVWHVKKNELTFFADWFRKDAAQIRKIFSFPEGRTSKTPYELSKYPYGTFDEGNRLVALLKKYPKELFFA